MKQLPLKAAIALTLIVSLSACESIDRHISGDSGMRLEVDVYKGPLALDPEIQWDRLQGQVGEAKNALELYIMSVKDLISQQADEDQIIHVGCTTLSSKEIKSLTNTSNFNYTKALNAQRLEKLLVDACDALNMVSSIQTNAMSWTKKYDNFRTQVTPDLAMLQELSPSPVNNQISTLNTDINVLKAENKRLSEELAAKLNGTAADQRKNLRGLLSQFVQIGTRLNDKAGYWSWAQSVESTSNLPMRQLIVGFSILVSEYSNRIISASDALLKQTYLADRRELPISSMIRDSKPTYVSKLLVFNKAAGYNNLYVGQDISYDRLRAMEQLYGDDSWANINQVYASGRGDTAMAFIKDDVGNWNLKNFDQDPSELIKAYKGMGLAVLDSAMKLAAEATTGNGADVAKKMFSLGNKLTMGGADMGEPAEARQIESLRKSAIKSLEAIRDRHKEQAAVIPSTDTTGLAKLSEETAKEVAAVLDAHNRIIMLLEEGIAEDQALN